MDGGTVDRLAAMGEAVLHVPVHQQHRAIRPLLDHGAGDALFLACSRCINNHCPVALLHGELGRAHEGRLAAHADQRRIQRVVGDQPQRAAGTEHVGTLVAIEAEAVATAHVELPNR
jgi:hypothetical protein